MPVSRQSNLRRRVEPDACRPTQLMNMLRDEARKQGKPFGLLFDNIEGGFTNTGRGIGQRLQRAAERRLSRSTPTIAAARARARRRSDRHAARRRSAKIVATGDKVDVFNGVCGAESGGVPVSASSPALLVSEVEVQKKAQSQETLPILPAPRAGEEVLSMRRDRLIAAVAAAGRVRSLRRRSSAGAAARRSRRLCRRCRTR